MGTISTHILDTARGRPAAGVAVTLEREEAGHWVAVGAGATDDDGRIKALGEQPLQAVTYRLTFATGAYFEAQGAEHFYPEVQVLFRPLDPSQHHHVPLLLNPFGYSTYRGS